MTWCPGHPSFITPPEGWGAAYTYRYDPANGRTVITPARKLVIHHSASNQPNPGQEASFTRQIEAYGESRDGAAVEYNYLIYPSGVLHGGFGDTRGCHCSATDPSTGGAYNSSSIGVCFVGYFHPPHYHQPTPAAIEVFQAWLDWMIDSNRLTRDVLVHASNPGNLGWYGHRDAWATACPGDTLYPKLPDIVQIGEAPPQPIGGSELTLALIIVDDAYAKFAGDMDAQGVVNTVRYLGPRLNSVIGFKPDNVTPRLAGTKVLHRKQSQMTDFNLSGVLPKGDKVTWTANHFYQGD